MYKFEWDHEKSAVNKKKHGVSFDEAIEIWQRPCLEISKIAYCKSGESRSATIGIIQGNIYTAIWINRNNNIRLISVRRSRNGEKKAFLEKI